MNRFAELLVSAAVKPATVVHLGAGSCKEYDLYTSLNASRIIFVEPDKKLAIKAKDKFRNSSHVTVIELAVAVEKGRQLLNIISNPRFSSLLQPAELLDFYPNITITDQIEIDAVTLEQICELENIDDHANNLMVAELQGIEKEVFPSVTKTTLHKFKWIVIRSSEHKLYGPVSDSPQKDLKIAMQEAGYIVFILKEEASPHTNMVCIRNDDRIANALLKQQEQALSKSIKVLEQQMLEDKADFEKQKSTYKKQLEGFEKSLQSKSAELIQSNAQVQSISAEKEKLSQDVFEQTRKATELATEITELKSEATKKVAEITGLKQEITGLKENIAEKTKELATEITELNSEAAKRVAEITELKSEATKRATEITELNSQATKRATEITELNSEATKRVAEITGLKQEIAGLKENITEKAKELAGIQQTLRINNKLMLKSNADLSDLQNQYRIAIQHQEQQHNLLCELKEKLSQAANFYRKLNLHNLVIDGDMLDQKDSKSEKSLSEDDSED